MKRTAWLAAAAFALFSCTPADRPGQSAAGGGGTLLIGNKGEDTLSFVSLADGREFGRAATGEDPHEIAVSPDGRTAAVVSYGARGIDVFDIGTRTKLRTIDLSPSEGPHGIVWLADGRLVVTTERSRSVAVVDTRRGDAVTTIATGQEGTHMVVVSPDGRRAFTANIGAGTVSVLDLAAGRKLRDIAVGGRPEGIALTPDGRTLWVGDLAGARVQVYDAATFERLGEVATGAVPIRVLASPDGRRIVTSNLGDGTLSVIDARTRRLAGTVTVSGTRAAQQVTILYSRDGRRLYAAETGRNTVAEVDLERGTVLRRLPAGTAGDGLAIAP
ncbi:MAG TPA: YncE family protein [Allosphingosinicella sp.]|nr:YncE family protein [Allosphingosinicella sp.]